ncbi:MAG: AfsR/SARP family transcriptional regulator, partial [Acidimicrobiales bacterium]
AYLALHPERPRRAEELRAALWPPGPDGSGPEARAETLRSYLSLLRRALGPDHVPPATGGDYRLDAETVSTDWSRFCSLVTTARTADPGAAREDLCAALALVRGRPFAGVSSGWAWVAEEHLGSTMEAAIVTAARHLVALSLNFDHDLAAFAIQRGLAAVPTDEGLHEDRLRLAARAGTGPLDRAWRDTQVVLGADHPFAALYRHLRRAP